MAQYTYSSKNGCVYGYHPGEGKTLPAHMVLMSAEETRVYEEWRAAAKKNRFIKCPLFPLQGTQTFIPKKATPKKTRKAKVETVIADAEIVPTDAELEGILDGANSS